MLELSKMLTVSTAHVDLHTAKLLDWEPEMNTLGLSVYSKGAPDQNYGWFIYIDTAAETYIKAVKANNPDKIPTELLNLLLLAIDVGAGVLCLDADGPEVPYLPRFEWDNITDADF